MSRRTESLRGDESGVAALELLERDAEQELFELEASAGTPVQRRELSADDSPVIAMRLGHATQAGPPSSSMPFKSPRHTTLSESLQHASDGLITIDRHLNCAGIDACKVLADLRDLATAVEEDESDSPEAAGVKGAVLGAVQAILADASAVLGNLGAATDCLVEVATIQEAAMADDLGYGAEACSPSANAAQSSPRQQRSDAVHRELQHKIESLEAELTAMREAALQAAEAASTAHDEGRHAPPRMTMTMPPHERAAPDATAEHPWATCADDSSGHVDGDALSAATGVASSSPQPRLSTEELLSEVAGLREQLAAAAEQLAARESDLGVGGQQLAEAIDELEAASDQLAAQAAELSTMGGQLAARDAELAAAGGQLAARESDLAAKDQQLAEAINQLEAASDQLAAQAPELSAMGGQLAARDAELSAAVEQLAARESDLAAGGQKLAEAIDELEAASDQLAAQAAELSAMGGQLAARDAEMAAAAKQLAARDSDLAAKDQQVAATEFQLAEAIEQLSAKSDLLVATAAELSARDGQLAANHIHLAAKNQRLAALDEQLAAAASQLAARDADLAAAVAQLASKDEQLSAKDAARAKLKRDLVHRLRDKDAVLKEAARALEASSTQLGELQGHLTALQQRKAAAEARAAAVSRRTTRDGLQTAEMERYLGEVSARLGDAHGTVSQLEARLAAVTPTTMASRGPTASARSTLESPPHALGDRELAGGNDATPLPDTAARGSSLSAGGASAHSGAAFNTGRDQKAGTNVSHGGAGAAATARLVAASAALAAAAPSEMQASIVAAAYAELERAKAAHRESLQVVKALHAEALAFNRQLWGQNAELIARSEGLQAELLSMLAARQGRAAAATAAAPGASGGLGSRGGVATPPLPGGAHTPSAGRLTAATPGTSVSLGGAKEVFAARAAAATAQRDAQLSSATAQLEELQGLLFGRNMLIAQLSEELVGVSNDVRLFEVAVSACETLTAQLNRRATPGTTPTKGQRPAASPDCATSSQAVRV